MAEDGELPTQVGSGRHQRVLPVTLVSEKLLFP